MARNGASSPLQKKPESIDPEKGAPSSSSSPSPTAAVRRPWKLTGASSKKKNPAKSEEIETVPNTEEPNSKHSSSRHLLLLLRRHSTVLRPRNNNRRTLRNCCFCCFCCFSYTCRDNQRSGAPSMAAGKDPVKSSSNSEKTGKENTKVMTQPTTSAGEYAQPTLEEIRSWGESFDSLMKCSAGRELFRQYLQQEYSEENLMFWSACEDLKQENRQEAIEEKARIIYEDFVSVLSPREVSLDSKVRELVNTNMTHPSANTFDEAQLQIYTLMHRDSYPRFLGSTIYRQLAQLSPNSRKTGVSVH